MATITQILSYEGLPCCEDYEGGHYLNLVVSAVWVAALLQWLHSGIPGYPSSLAQ